MAVPWSLLSVAGRFSKAFLRRCHLVPLFILELGSLDRKPVSVLSRFSIPLDLIAGSMLITTVITI